LSQQQQGFLGAAPGFWDRLATIGSGMATAANARGPGGFLQYGQGLAGPLAAGIQADQQRRIDLANLNSNLAYRNAATQGQQLPNYIGAMNLPLAQMQNQIRTRFLSDPTFRQQFIGSQPTATGDTPQGGSDFSNGIAKLEGNGENPRWPIAQGGPDGPHQFTAATWNQFAQENPSYFQGMNPRQVLQARRDPQLSATATDWYATKNTPILQANGIEATPANLGIAHTLGPLGASVLKFPDQTPLSQAFSITQPQMAQQIRSKNPQYAQMSVGQLRQKYAFLNGPVPGQQSQAPQASGGPAPGRFRVA